MSANDGVGILLCTHLLDDVDRFCTHLGILSKGKTVLGALFAVVLGADAVAGERERGSLMPLLLTSLIAWMLLASPLLLGPSLRQSTVGKGFDAANPFSSSLNAFDSVVIDSQPFTMQTGRLAVALAWFVLTAWYAVRSVRKLEL